MSDGKPTSEVLHSHSTHTLTGNGPFILDFQSGMVHGDAGTSFPPAGAGVRPDLQNARASTRINRPMYANRKRRFAEIRRADDHIDPDVRKRRRHQAGLGAIQMKLYGGCKQL